jgi:nitrogen fixation/metabolism regulation signal transduction histidine kinase
MSASIPSEATPPFNRRQRHLRNYLLDHHFQLKYTGYLVGIAIVLSIFLGALLWSMGRDVIAQSQETVRRGQETVRQGQDVIHESKKVSEVVRMNIVHDPVYADNPELLAVFNQNAIEQDRRLEQQQRNLQADAAHLEDRAQSLVAQQRRMFAALVLGLLLLVVVIGGAGIVVTHKVAGPVHKMKRLIGYVGDGHFNLHARLRKGDELQDFFEAFEAMVESLRQRQERSIDKIDEALRRLEPIASADELTSLRSFRAEMRDTLKETRGPATSVPPKKASS